MEGIEDGACIASSPLDLEDIEDLIENSNGSASSKHPINRAENRKNVVIPKVRKRDRQKKRLGIETVGNGTDVVSEQVNTFLPGTATVYVKTWGCAHNSSDGE